MDCKEDVRSILAKTAWGEARGMGYLGMKGTINVVQNRVKSGITWWGHDEATCCLQRFQFSCWLESDPNRDKLDVVTEADPEYATALELADSALAGTLDDITNGADSYFNHHMPTALWPKWAIGQPVYRIEPHWYFITRCFK